MPAFNSAQTIQNSISSVLDSSYKNLELLVYNDASTDDTGEIIRKLAATDPRIKLFDGHTNKGAGYARNFLLQKVSGEIIAFLDSDDVWYREKLQEQIATMVFTDADIVTSAYKIIDENDNILTVNYPSKKVNYFSMHLSNWLPTSMTILRADLNSARQMPNLRTRQDYAYWLEIFRANKIKYASMNDIHGTYLKRNDSLSSNKYKNFIANALMFRHACGYGWITAFFFTFLNTLYFLKRKFL